jgi:hypothetical protein
MFTNVLSLLIYCLFYNLNFMQALWIYFPFQKKMTFSKYKLSTTLIFYFFINDRGDMFYYTFIMLLGDLIQS